MKKEVFLAIAVGFVLGLVIKFWIWTANKSLKQLPAVAANPVSVSPSAAPEVTPQPTPPVGAIPLTISSPDQEALFSKTPITVTGRTAPGATVAVIYETGDQMMTADTSGNFAFDIPLEGGYNVVRFTSFDSQGNQAATNLTLTYSTAKI